MRIWDRIPDITNNMGAQTRCIKWKRFKFILRKECTLNFYIWNSHRMKCMSFVPNSHLIVPYSRNHIARTRNSNSPGTYPPMEKGYKYCRINMAHNTSYIFRRAKKMSTAGSPLTIKVRDNIPLQYNCPRLRATQSHKQRKYWINKIYTSKLGGVF